MKINSIKKVPFTGKVFNLELKSNSQEDDLFWIEGTSGIITHNCFPKDLAALIHLAENLNVTDNVLSAAEQTNTQVRTNRDWEQMKGRAVS